MRAQCQVLRPAYWDNSGGHGKTSQSSCSIGAGEVQRCQYCTDSNNSRRENQRTHTDITPAFLPRQRQRPEYQEGHQGNAKYILAIPLPHGDPVLCYQMQ